MAIVSLGEAAIRLGDMSILPAGFKGTCAFNVVEVERCNSTSEGNAVAGWVCNTKWSISVEGSIDMG